MTLDAILRVVDVMAALFTVGSIVVGAVVTWGVLRLKVRRSRIQKQIGKSTATRFAAVVIAFRCGDPEQAVLKHLTNEHPIREFERIDYKSGSHILVKADTVPLVMYHHADALAKVDLERHLETIQALQRSLDEAGYKEVLLFQQGTLAFATLVGTLFANWGIVHVHHYDATNAAYENWIPLSAVKYRDKIPSAPLDLIAETVLEVVGDKDRDRRKTSESLPLP